METVKLIQKLLYKQSCEVCFSLFTMYSHTEKKKETKSTRAAKGSAIEKQL